MLLGISERIFYFLVLGERPVGNCAVNFHKILIYHTPCADIEVTHL